MTDIFNTENNTTREAYLAWVANWKATYEALSTEIRSKRIETKNLMRADLYAGSEQWKLQQMSWRANRLLELRKSAKEEAAANRAKQLEQEAA